MKITNQYSYIKPSITNNNYHYTPSFGISFKKSKLLTDIFLRSSSITGVTKIKNLHAGEFGTECKYSRPLENFEEQFGLKKLRELYKKGFSTNTEGWADCFLKSSADTPLSTSSVYDCSVLYLFNKNTNTHLLYHSYYEANKDSFEFLIKNFMPEGFTKADILPGDRKWYMRHWETLPQMLKALKASGQKAEIDVHHYSSQLPEIVGYNGNLYEIVNRRTALGLSDKGQASFRVCDLRVNSLVGEIDFNACTTKKIALQRKRFAAEKYDPEVIKILNNLLDKHEGKVKQIEVCNTPEELDAVIKSFNASELYKFARALGIQKQKILAQKVS